MLKTIVHINRHTILRNRKFKRNDPAIAVRRGKSGKARYAHQVWIKGPSRVVTSMTPLKCGATVWIETDAEVALIVDDDLSTAPQEAVCIS